MSDSSDPPKPRRPRADAKRNRDRLLDVAKAAFAAGGADVTLDDVAKAAEVGAGTLYRHFPTRDALIEAVYSAEVEQLAQAADRLGRERPPVEALREWMSLFVDYIAAKQLIAPALNGMVGGPSEVFARSGELVKDAIRGLVRRAVATGQIRGDLDPIDLLRALVGVSNVAVATGWEASAKRLVDILIAGSRPASD
jgi:AcrR family transcriptional regulator